MVKTKEFEELRKQFEKDAKDLFYGHKVERYGRGEDVPAGQFYQDGFVNNMFVAYMHGYAFHKSIANLEG
jgi:hypothetical protein